jgi:hypothetical protein
MTMAYLFIHDAVLAFCGNERWMLFCNGAWSSGAIFKFWFTKILLMSLARVLKWAGVFMWKISWPASATVQLWVIIVAAGC